MTAPVEERVFASNQVKVPRAFFLSRVHSLLGLWLVIYLFEHLLVNAQAALFVNDDASRFIRAVNFIHALPYLKAIELIFLGAPFLIHGIWGIKYACKAKFNSFKSSGKTPSLPQYKRNRAYTWQRVTAWILVFAIIAHVIQMRFLDSPKEKEGLYTVRVTNDVALRTVAEKLHVQLVGESKGKLIAIAPSAGAAFFLVVRDTMKDPLMVVLYTIFVVCACYHAFNGLWTFMITWGITLTRQAQYRMRTITNSLMAFVMFLGLMAIWGSYWTYLFQR